MKKLALSVACTLALAAGVGAFLPEATAGGQARPDRKSVPNVTGKWVMTLDMSMGVASPMLELKQDGEKLTGTYTGRYGTFALDGSLKATAIQFSFTMGAEGQESVMSFAGEVSADGTAMKGTASLGEMGDATWTAKKQ